MIKNIKDIVLFVSVLFLIILIRLSKAAMVCIRLFTYWFIVIGALGEITSGRYTLWIYVNILQIFPESLSQIAIIIDTHWMPCALLILFLQSWHRKRTYDELLKTSNYTRMFVAMMGNYFGLSVRTTAMDDLKQGFVGSLKLKETFEQLKSTLFFGGEIPDSLLTAYPVRGSSPDALGKVTFEEDVKQFLKADEKKM